MRLADVHFDLYSPISTEDKLVISPPELSSSSSVEEVVDYFNHQWLIRSDNGELHQDQQTALVLLKEKGVDGEILPIAHFLQVSSFMGRQAPDRKSVV